MLFFKMKHHGAMVACNAVLLLAASEVMGDSPANTASIPCGELNPNLMAEAYRDDRPSDSNSDPMSLSQNHAFATVQEGDGPPLSVANSFPSNGGGAASAKLYTKCTRVVQGKKDDALTILNLLEILTANNATDQNSSGSGFGPGGEAASNPEWRTTLFLPGSSHAQWKVDLIASLNSQFKSRSCSLSLDGQPVKGTSASATGGSHLLDFACVSATGSASHFPILGDRGGWGSTVTQSESVNLVVHATRE
jgi:hypothetical protein